MLDASGGESVREGVGSAMAYRHGRFRYLLVAALTLIVLGVVNVPSASAAETPNPPWRAHCPARVGILIDQSQSMSGRFGEVRTAVSDAVDALRNNRSEMTIVGFGTTANVLAAGVDVSDSDKRHALKSQVDNLDALDGDAGGTNWQAALQTVLPLQLDVVILVTDGEPDVSDNGSDALSAAVDVANQLKAGGTRVDAVGIDLQPDGTANLQAVTGPTDGQDYYSSDTSGLLHHLYQIVAATCGVPLTALPTPEPPTFPWLTVILAMVGGLAAIGVIGFLLSRRRGGPVARRPVSARRRGRVTVADTSMNHSELAKTLRDSKPTDTSPITEDPS